MARRQSLDEAVFAEAARLYESGLLQSQVAERLKMNQETMLIVLIKANVELRPASGK